MRTLTPALSAALADGQRRPAYKLLAYDTSLDSISDIVCGTATQTPLDVTSYVKTIAWQDTRMDFTVVDPGGVFHPDTGANRAYLADGAVIRLKEGDLRVPESQWAWTFTGLIRGQVGWQVNRVNQVMESQVAVFSRDNLTAWKKRTVTSDSYTVGTELGVVLDDILQNTMGLAAGEIRIPQVLGLQLLHQTTQISDMTPWDIVATILQAVAKSPRFDGEGKLFYVDKNLSRMPDKEYEDYRLIQDYQIPARNQDFINKVTVKFLDATLSKVENDYQSLGTAAVTTGFFSMGETLPVWWSDDHKQRAEDTHMVVKKSVNSGILPVGCEDYSPIDDFHGEITVEISVWVPILAAVCLAAYLAMAVIPDDVIVFGLGWGVTVATGITISVGRVIQAAALIVILLIMMSIGSAQYEIWGTPFDYAYVQQTSAAVVQGTETYEENSVDYENNFLGSFDQADTIAVTELIWQRSIGIPRKLTVVDDLALEPGDLITLPDGRKFVITGMEKTITRGEIPLLILNGSKVLTI